MKLHNILAAGALVVASQFALPASAQSVSVASVTQACVAGAGCVAAVQQFVAALKAQGLTPAAIDTQLSSLSVSLGQAVVDQELPATVTSAISQGISEVANNVADQAQRTETQQVANAVEAVSEGTASREEIATADGTDAGGIQGSGG